LENSILLPEDFGSGKFARKAFAFFERAVFYTFDSAKSDKKGRLDLLASCPKDRGGSLAVGGRGGGGTVRI